MPSKGLLRPVEVLDTARNVPGVAGIVADASVVAPAVLARRDEIVNHLDDSSQVAWAEGAGIDVIRGRARLSGVKTVEVTAEDGSTRTVHARHAVVLDTGSTARIPPITGLRDALPWTSRDATNMHTVPRRMVIIGGGVVACEAATWLIGLGVRELTVVAAGPQLLERNEPFAGEYVAAALREWGVRVHLDAAVERVNRIAPQDTGIGQIHGGEVSVHFAGQSVVADEVLVATGRSPASRDLGLETVALATGGDLASATDANGGYVDVDDHFAVAGVPGDWLYAVGDVNGRALLTHMGKYQARICGTVIAARAQGMPVAGARMHDVAGHGIVPQVVFTNPQVASVGLTESQARGSGADVETVEYDLAALAGTYLQRENYTGRAKLVVDRASDTLLGATFVGPDVAELVHGATIAIAGRVTLDRLWHAVPAYPTVSEVWLRLLEAREKPN
jgi:dihydrolipoamide dehydrogenase